MKMLRKLIKPIYDILPYKKLIFSLLKVIGLKGNITKFLYFRGTFSFKYQDHKIKLFNPGYQSHIENQIFWNGIEKSWEPTSLKLWSVLSRNSNVILDIGANTGLYSIIAKISNVNSRVIAFEPIEFIQEYLIKNIKFNRLNIELSNYALSNSNTNITVQTDSLINSYTISIDNLNAARAVRSCTKLNIQTLRLEDYIRSENIKSVDLMKIDVERHEPMVLEGMGKYLSSFKPDMLIEIQSPLIAEKIHSLVSDIDYCFFNIVENKGLFKIDSLNLGNNQNYLICNPSTVNNISQHLQIY